MGGIGVEEAAAVGAEFLDRLLARHRPEGGLLGAFERRHVDGAVKRLRHAERNERERDDDRERQQHVKRDAGQIDPEIADGPGRGRANPRTSANAMRRPVAAERKLCIVRPSIWRDDLWSSRRRSSASWCW